MRKVCSRKTAARKPVVIKHRSEIPVEKGTGSTEEDIGELRQALSQAAQIYFSEAAATAEERLPFSAYHFDDVSVRLGVPRDTVEMWLKEYEDLFGAEVSWKDCMISHEGVKKLSLLQELDHKGVGAGDIRMTLGTQDESSPLQERIEEVLAALERIGGQRDKDRYTVLKEINRAREEIQHLRHELVAAIPRRARRRSFWSRLVGS